MKYRIASAEDCPTLAALNAQLIQDEGHRNPDYDLTLEIMPQA